jgi:hypothetical protein
MLFPGRIESRFDHLKVKIGKKLATFVVPIKRPGFDSEKIISDRDPNYRTFYPKKLSLSSQKYGFGIPDPGVQKAPDPGSGFATLKSKTLLTYLGELVQVVPEGEELGHHGDGGEVHQHHVVRPQAAQAE